MSRIRENRDLESNNQPPGMARTEQKGRRSPRDKAARWGFDFKTRIFLILLLTGLGIGLHNSSAGESFRETRTNMMVYADAQGKLRLVKTKSDWDRRRSMILRGMSEVMGELPAREQRLPLDFRIISTEDKGDVVLKSVDYLSEPNSRVPAWLLLPKRLRPGSKAPGILALHPTDMEYGNRVVVETLRPYYRAYAMDLARSGYVVLAPAYPLMANYQPDLARLHWRSGTLKAVWDNIRGLDLLASLPEVKPGGFGVIGHSLGGHNALFTAVFDARIKVVVSSCGFDSFVDYMGGKIDGWTSARYMPALGDYRARLEAVPFDFPEVLSALAPRYVFVNAPLHDDNFQSKSVDTVLLRARPVFTLLGAKDRLQVVHPDCGHDFPQEIREQAYRFIESVLPPAH